MKSKSKLIIVLLVATTALAGCQTSASNSESVAGVDSDKNGIRDDIDLFLQKSYKSSGYNLEAISNVAKSIQAAIVSDKSNMGQISKINEEMASSVDCMSSSFKRAGKGDHFAKTITQIEDYTVNTEKRKEEYDKFNKASEHAIVNQMAMQCQSTRLPTFRLIIEKQILRHKPSALASR